MILRLTMSSDIVLTMEVQSWVNENGIIRICASDGGNYVFHEDQVKEVREVRSINDNV